MNPKLIKIVLSVVLVAAVTGCQPSPERFPLSDAQKELIKQNKSPLVIVLTPEGHFLAADENGKTLGRCTVGPKGSPDLKPCQGLQKDYAVQSLSSVMIIRSKKNPECYTFYDPALNIAQELCW